MLACGVYFFALSIDDFKTIVAFLTDANLCIELLAILLNLATYSVGVEVEIL
jgi:hypothetical protein